MDYSNKGSTNKGYEVSNTTNMDLLDKYFSIHFMQILRFIHHVCGD